MKAGRTAVFRLVAVLAGIAAALLLGEVALRVLLPPSATQVLRGLHVARPDRAWLYGLEPDAERRDPTARDVVYAVNADGFRDRSYARPKPEGTFRVVVLGDSLTFGYGVALEATFAKLLEARLQTISGGPSYEVLNLGVSGYNPYTELALLEDVGMGYAPDLVLAQFCINDLNDPTMHFDTSTMLELGAVPDAAFPDPEAHRRVAPTGGIARLRARIARACERSRLCSLVADALPEDADAHREAVGALGPHEVPSPGEIAWLEGIYARMAEVARARGGAFVLVVFPWETQLGTDAPTAVQEDLRTLGERLGFPVIDLLPAFRRAAELPGEPLFVDLWHPSRRGQQVAAREIFRQLACARLLPGVDARCEPGPEAGRTPRAARSLRRAVRSRG